MLFIPSFHEIGRANTPWTVTADYFDTQLRNLRNAGFRFISVGQIESALDSPGERYCLVTFDDGRKGAFLEGLPILTHHRAPAVFYLCTGFINGEDVPDKERYSDFIGWEDAVRILEWGHTIGSHSRRHRLLTELRDDELAQELIDSKQEIEACLGVRCEHFAAPFGIMNRRELEQAKRAGYSTCAAGEGIADRPFYLRRVFVQEGADLVSLADRFDSRRGATAIVVRTGEGPVAFGAESLRVFSRFDNLLCDSEESRKTLSPLPAMSRALDAASSAVLLSSGALSIPDLEKASSPVTTVLLPGSGREPYFVRFADREEGLAINNLFNHCFGQSRTLDQWLWKFADREGIAPKLVVAQQGAEVVGEYVAIPYWVSAPDGTALAYQVVDNCIHESHRSFGIQRAMWARFCAETIWRKVDFAFGFPGGLALEIGRSRLGYEPRAAFVEMRIEVPGRARRGSSLVLHEVDRFTCEHEELFSASRTNGSVELRKSVEYLNWRYIDAPGYRFIARELRTSDGKLSGIVIYRSEKERATLYDLCFPGGTAEFVEAWHALSEELEKRGMRYMRTVATPSHPVVAFLSSVGAKHHQPDNYTFVFSANERNARRFRDADWRFILGDSDL